MIDLNLSFLILGIIKSITDIWRFMMGSRVLMFLIIIIESEFLI